MGSLAVEPSSASASSYVSWEEVNVLSDKGRREVHYYLKRRDGSGSDLAVIAKERSCRQTSYHYVNKSKWFCLSTTTSLFKLRSRREVIDWLNSIISDKAVQGALHSAAGSKEPCGFDTEACKDVRLQKLGHNSTEFLWLGSPWMSRKRRMHYQSFCRNGVKISVLDFVYVLAEEDKRLVAYLEDMYEDSKGNKMVLVRWFHKIDEVGIILPHNYNDREIFFSLCLQDLSIECIDGLAAVLSPQHFKKFLNEVTHTQLQPFVCHKLFENDDVKPFDITQVKGYWKQEILRYSSIFTSSSDCLNSQLPCDGQIVEREDGNDVAEIRPSKRHRRLKDDDVYPQPAIRTDSMVTASVDGQISCKSSNEFKFDAGLGDLVGVHSAAPFSGKESNQNTQHLKVGSHIEVLSQDSGMRGCWFRALVIKKHKNKVKVRYHDVHDAADEANLLEEWVLAAKVAAPDHLGLRFSGRTIVRPAAKSHKGKVSWAVDVGTIVDAWWHDGWWEGIVIHKESEEKFHVYFPGEKQKSIFGRGDLRHSQEWVENQWIHVKERPDVVRSILSCFGMKQVMEISLNDNSVNTSIDVGEQTLENKTDFSESLKDDQVKHLDSVPDLSKDDLLAQLRWKSSRKRRRAGVSSVHKLHNRGCGSKNTIGIVGSSIREKFFISRVDHDNCKYMRDSLFGSSVVPPLTSLVMSR